MRTLVVTAVMAVVLAGCGASGTRPDAAASNGRSPSSSPSPAQTSSPRPTIPHPTPGSTSSGTSTPPPAPLGTSEGGRVMLGRPCVHRGDPAEPQELTVEAGPGETVGYSTYYSDYSSELDRPDYTTGHGYGEAGPDRRFGASWVVPATATLGRATVQVVATDMSDPQSVSFDLVAQGAPCP